MLWGFIYSLNQVPRGILNPCPVTSILNMVREDSIQIADIYFWHKIVRISWLFPKSDHFSFIAYIQQSTLFRVFHLNCLGLGKHVSWLSFLGLSELVTWLYVLQDQDSAYLLNFFHYFSNADYWFFFFSKYSIKLCQPEWHKQSTSWSNLSRRCYLLSFKNIKFFCSFATDKAQIACMLFQ